MIYTQDSNLHAMKTLYLVSLTDTMQQYNSHSLFTSREQANEAFEQSKKGIQSSEEIIEVLEDDSREFYFEHKEGYGRLYIEELTIEESETK